MGFLFGRSEPGVDWTLSAELASKLKRRFEQTHGTTNCGSLLATFGPQENMMRCKRLSGEVAGMLADIIPKWIAATGGLFKKFWTGKKSEPVTYWNLTVWRQSNSVFWKESVSRYFRKSVSPKTSLGGDWLHLPGKRKNWR